MWAGNNNSTFYRVGVSSMSAADKSELWTESGKGDFTLRPSHLTDSKNNKVHFHKHSAHEFPKLGFC